jgi:hypothetical protein
MLLRLLQNAAKASIVPYSKPAHLEAYLETSFAGTLMVRSSADISRRSAIDCAE